MKIPIVENIHQKVLELVQLENGKVFDMSGWQDSAPTECGMTYCRGGAVVLAAGKAGVELKDQTSWEFAAMQIYKASSPIKVSPVRFYETNEVALKDIQRCSDEEAILGKK